MNIQDKLINEILDNGDEFDDLLRRPLLNALRQIATGPSVSVSQRQSILDGVFALWTDSIFWQYRRVLVDILYESTNPDFIEDLTPRLISLAQSDDADDWGVSISRTLAKLGKRQEAVSILNSLAHAAYEEVADEVVEAATALGELGDIENATSVLLKLICDKYVPERDRCDAAKSLGLFGKHTQGTINDLLKLAHDQGANASVRCAVCDVLIGLGESHVIAILRTIAQDETIEGPGRCHAAQSLGKLGEKEVAVPILLDLLHDKDGHFSIGRIAFALSEIGERSTGIAILMEALEDKRTCPFCGEKSCTMGRGFAANALVRLGEEEVAASIMLETLADDTLGNSGRLSIASSLGKLGRRKEATPHFLRILHGDVMYDFERSTAIKALGKWGERSEEVMQELLAWTKGRKGNSSERRYAIEALGNLGIPNHEVLQTLAKIARTDSEFSIKHSAGSALWTLIGFDKALDSVNKKYA